MNDNARQVAAGTANGGLGLSGVLTVIFVVLKLVGEHFHTPVADWSWWWVLSPLWLPPAVVLGIVILGGLFVGVVMLAAWPIERLIEKVRGRKHATPRSTILH